MLTTQKRSSSDDAQQSVNQTGWRLHTLTLLALSSGILSLAALPSKFLASYTMYIYVYYTYVIVCTMYIQSSFRSLVDLIVTRKTLSMYA